MSRRHRRAPRRFFTSHRRRFCRRCDGASLSQRGRRRLMPLARVPLTAATATKTPPPLPRGRSTRSGRPCSRTELRRGSEGPRRTTTTAVPRRRRRRAFLLRLTPTTTMLATTKSSTRTRRSQTGPATRRGRPLALRRRHRRRPRTRTTGSTTQGTRRSLPTSRPTSGEGVATTAPGSVASAGAPRPSRAAFSHRRRFRRPILLLRRRRRRRRRSSPARRSSTTRPRPSPLAPGKPRIRTAAARPRRGSLCERSS